MGLPEDDRYYEMLDRVPHDCEDCGRSLHPEDDQERVGDVYFCPSCADRREPNDD